MESGGPIALLVALREELRAVEPLLQRRRAVKTPTLRFRKGRLGGVDVVIARTGMGAVNAADKTAALLDLVSPSCILAVGFGGGLRADLASGDVVVGRDVVEAAVEPRTAAPRSWTAPTHLLEAALAAGEPPLRVRAGRILTVRSVLASSTAKRRAGDEGAADAVDMESSAVAAVATARGVSVLCARAILDELDYELPFDFGRILTADGRLRPLATVAAIVSHPRGLLDLEPLRRRARAAAATLAAFVPALVARIGTPS